LSSSVTNDGFLIPEVLVAESIDAGEIWVRFPLRAQYYRIGNTVVIWGSVNIRKSIISGHFPAVFIKFINSPEVPFGGVSPTIWLPATINSTRNMPWQAQAFTDHTTDNFSNIVTLALSIPESDNIQTQFMDDQLAFQVTYSTDLNSYA
jgi:hypothetical protein